jgi:hypothetical protein
VSHWLKLFSYGGQSMTSRDDHKILAAARHRLPELARKHPDRPSLRAALIREFPTVPEVLGDAWLDSWIWTHLRSLKQGSGPAAPPLFGVFGRKIQPREKWDEPDWLIYLSRYKTMRDNADAKLLAMEAEYELRFGHAPQWDTG